MSAQCTQRYNIQTQSIFPICIFLLCLLKRREKIHSLLYLWWKSRFSITSAHFFSNKKCIWLFDFFVKQLYSKRKSSSENRHKNINNPKINISDLRIRFSLLFFNFFICSISTKIEKKIGIFDSVYIFQSNMFHAAPSWHACKDNKVFFAFITFFFTM